MERVDIVCVGTLKEKYLRELCAEYQKRLTRFCKLNIVELAESKLPSDPSDKEIERALENEAKSILSATEGSYRIAMCIEGDNPSSEKLAKIMENAAAVKGRVSFIIGSSHGLADCVKNASDMRISMSRMTFPHQIARGMLLEQIYRTYMVRGGGSYHK